MTWTSLVLLTKVFWHDSLNITFTCGGPPTTFGQLDGCFMGSHKSPESPAIYLAQKEERGFAHCVAVMGLKSI